MTEELHARHLGHLVAVCDCGLSMSVAACRLGISQSAISRSVQILEQNLGGALFVRNGKRITATTPLCNAVIELARDINAKTKDLQLLANASKSIPTHGEIRVACTHLQARYILPIALKSIYKYHPQVKVIIHQCFPSEINNLLISSQVDLGICSEKLIDESLMHSVHAYTWERAMILPKKHKFINQKKITINDLAKEQIITYVHGITGRRQFDTTFANAGLYPNIVIAAADSDVVKQFTKEGFGIGIIAALAYDPKYDKELTIRKLPTEFGEMHSRIIYRKQRRLNPVQKLFVKAYCEVSAECANKSSALLT